MRYGNMHNKRALVLHLGDPADSPVAVVLEVKGSKNPGEMLAPDDLIRKAFQLLLPYYLEDRTDEQVDDRRRARRGRRCAVVAALCGVVVPGGRLDGCCGAAPCGPARLVVVGGGA